jgi:hypothetical protein
MVIGLIWPIVEVARGEEPYENYYLYLGNYPGDREITMSEQIQGVTHDGTCWFFTQRTTLWKIPVWYDLNQEFTCNNASISCVQMGDIGDLSGYNHFGDLCYYGYGGEGYLFVPVEGSEPSIIAVFAVSDLHFVGKEYVDDRQQNHASWCAVFSSNDPDWLYLYSSAWEDVSKFQRYLIHLPSLANDKLVMNYDDEIVLLNESWSSYELDYVQGGCFSPSGQYLYTSNGDCEHDCDCGIHVFEKTPLGFHLVRSSEQDEYPFKYEYHPSWTCGEEPEGLTIWDLDGGEAPGISGQLHALMISDELGQDDMYFKHYTNTILVDPDNAGGNQYGTPDEPFATISDAYDYAWNGSRIKIKSGSYDEILTFAKRMQVLAIGGPVRIGIPGHIFLTPSGTINIYSGGALRIY